MAPQPLPIHSQPLAITASLVPDPRWYEWWRSVDTTLRDLGAVSVPQTRVLTAGAGLTGGGDLSVDRTFNVGAGTGITVNTNDVAITATGVTAAAYGGSGKRTAFTVNAQGQLTAASDASITAAEITSPAALTRVDDTNVTLTLGGTPSTALLRATSITVGWSGTLAAGRLNSNVVQGVTNDTNVTGSISAQNLTLGWTGTLAAGRLNSNVVQGVTNDTNVTGSISAQNLTLGWSGTLAAGRLNSNVVQAVSNDTNVTGSIATQTLQLSWSGQLAVGRGGSGAATLTGLLQGNGTSAFTTITNSTTVGQVLRVTGSNTYAWGALDLSDSDAITGDLPFANLTQGSALSVLGVTGNSTADHASIAAGSDHQVLRRSGTAVAFGAVNLASSNAVTGALPVANGGTNASSASGTALDNITGFSSNGLLARTGSGTYAQRTLTAGTAITVTNGDGVSGNPTVAVSDAELTAIAGLTSAANKVPYFTGSGTAALGDFANATTSITPVWSAASVNPTIGNGSLTGSAIRIGAMIYAAIDLDFGTTTTFGTGVYTFSLPSPFNGTAVRAGIGSAIGYKDGVAFYTGIAIMYAGFNTLQIISHNTGNYWSATVPATWAGPSDFFRIGIWIPIA